MQTSFQHNRRSFIGGSDARIIWVTEEGGADPALAEKRGEIEPKDLSGNLIVQLGKATEELNRRWFETNSGHELIDVQRQVRHSVLPWMGATLDGRVEATEPCSRLSSCCLVVLGRSGGRKVCAAAGSRQDCGTLCHYRRRQVG